MRAFICLSGCSGCDEESGNNDNNTADAGDVMMDANEGDGSIGLANSGAWYYPRATNIVSVSVTAQ